MRFAIGTIPFGTTVGQPESFALLDHFVEAGGTAIDTSNNYPSWRAGCTGDESEATIGAWLASRKSRDHVFISTKVGARPRQPGDTTFDGMEGLSAPVIRAGIDASLRRLGTDRLDLYWAHIDDRATPLAATVGAFDELVRSGKALRVGASNTPVWRVERARALAMTNGQTPYTALQLRHTYVRPRPGVRPSAVQECVTDETLDFLADQPDVALWAYSTLLSGAYSRSDRQIEAGYLHPGTERRLAVLAQIAAELAVTANHVVLAWLMADGIRPIVGVSTAEQLDVAIEASMLTLDAGTRARLDAPR
jgi:aryl-alcohol dehydrogenase-like predicted oxidoreductase